MRSSDAVRTRISATYHEDILALCRNAVFLAKFHSSQYSVLLGQQFECEMHAFEFSSRCFQVACYRSSSADDISIKAFRQCILLNRSIVFEDDAFLFQQCETTVNDGLVELEVRNTIAKQTTSSLIFLKHGDGISHLVKSVSGYESGRTSSDDSDSLAITLVSLRLNVVFSPCSLSDSGFILTVGYWSMVCKIEHASLFA